ncbi:TrbC/VirB2 family protein [Candidatus Deianiraea vastatrix]|uniref:Type IV secretion system VirB2 n=1 Tax=Candidatus Deianiraea vastatrix TaxID=2163644 RepID=A0A5B8XIL3_9RICK|nr:TrbC/VirB2 family protein [Candidatus Deianiraea vastatrix]QED23821.1 Putative type IV secretion system VirB2 [Candidatus Deianiraea vastatrix]
MLKYLVLSIVILFSTATNKANAVARGAACNLTTASSTGDDGSNCDAGLVCQASSGKCGRPSETICTALRQCTIGYICRNDDGTTVIQPGSNDTTFGVCYVKAGSTESNPFGDALCGVYLLATGKVGRGIVVVVIFVIGISFYLGKVSWGTVVAVVIGVGFCFGGPAIVSILVGKSFVC